MNDSAKTKQQQALILLLDEEEFDRISVSKICKEAGVHRSTFYSYYDNQFDLLEDTYQYLTQLFFAEFQLYHENSSAYLESNLLSNAHLIPYLQFVKDYQKIYKIYLSHELEFHHQERFDSFICITACARKDLDSSICQSILRTHAHTAANQCLDLSRCQDSS